MTIKEERVLVLQTDLLILLITRKLYHALLENETMETYPTRVYSRLDGDGPDNKGMLVESTLLIIFVNMFSFRRKCGTSIDRRCFGPTCSTS